MGRWSDRIEELLYDGETVDERVEIGSAMVAVTSHRVLAFTPESGDANFQQVDRPNVTGVSLGAEGDTKFLRQGVRAAVYGLIFVVAGLFIPIDSILGDVSMPSTTGQLGIGGVLGMFQMVISLLKSLDDIMQLIGGLLLLFALVPMGVYLWSRERSLVIDVAGEEGIKLPAPEEDGESVVEQLEAAIFPEGIESESESRFNSPLG